MNDTKNELAIEVKNLHKTFKIPIDGGNNLKQKIVNFARHKKGYREFSPLNGIDFEIKKGEFFGIVGRNGSGKSTLLKTIAGIYTPDSGKIKVDGTLVPFIELGVGFNPELTGRENVYLNGALLGFSRNEMSAMYEEIVDFAELHDFMDERLKNYSSGMQVRLAFSIAIRAKGDVLLLDEVLAVGDSAFQQKCFDYFAKLKSENRTVVLVTHSMSSVQRFCDRALLLDGGKVKEVGDSEYIAQQYDQLFRIAKTDKPESKGVEPTLSGNNAVTIKEVTILGKDNKAADTFLTGEPFKVKLLYKVNKKIEHINFGIGLHHSQSKAHIFGYNTLMDQVDVNMNLESIVLEFDVLPLLKGSYRLSVNCFGSDRHIPYDSRVGVLEFDVLSYGDERKYGGLVSIPHRWIL